MRQVKVWVGDTTEIPVRITSGGIAYDLTGKTLIWYLASIAAPGVALVTKTVTTHTDAAGGLSAVTLTPADLIAAGGACTCIMTCVLSSGGSNVTRGQFSLVIGARPT